MTIASRVNIKSVSKSHFLKVNKEFSLTCIDDGGNELSIKLPLAGMQKILLSMEVATSKGYLTADDFPQAETMINPVNLEISSAPGGIMICPVLQDDRRIRFFFGSPLPDTELKKIALEIVGSLERAKRGLYS